MKIKRGQKTMKMKRRWKNGGELMEAKEQGQKFGTGMGAAQTW